MPPIFIDSGRKEDIKILISENPPLPPERRAIQDGGF